jgi:Tol biopolymer transport system component
MRSLRRRLVLALAAAVALVPHVVLAGGDEEKEHRFLRNIRQLTTGKDGERAGEPYVSPDGKRVIFQAVREGCPYYQIYVVPIEGGEPKLLSPGKGKTTCSYFDPVDADKFIFASTHLDERTYAPPPKEDPSKPKSYKWDYDGSFDIFEGSFKSGAVTKRLTDAPGYDAEGSISHDGKHICFTSGRDGPNAIYVMDRDGKNPLRIAPEKGSKLAGGGPFFMPGDKEVVYRAQDSSDPHAPMHAYVTSVDGKTTRQLTRAPRMNWCPYPHPDGKKVVYAAAIDGHKNFELFLLKTDGSYKEVRLTWNDGFDALPSFSPDGTKLVWTSTRHGGAPQVFVADFADPPESAYEVQSDEPEKPKDEHGAVAPAPSPEHAKAEKPENPHADPHGGSGAFDPKTTGVIKGSEGFSGDSAKNVLGADHVEEFGLTTDIRWLADPEREGRRAGTAGERAAARYVETRFQELGVAPGGFDGSYEQPFTVLAGARVVADKCSLGFGAGADAFTPEKGDAWRPLLYSANGTVEGDVVFCGYGIEDKDHGYDDYAGVDVKDKIALVSTRAPRSDKGGAFGATHATMLEDIRFKVSLARNHGAKAVVFFGRDRKSDAWLELGYGDPGIPVLQLSATAIGELGFVVPLHPGDRSVKVDPWNALDATDEDLKPRSAGGLDLSFKPRGSRDGNAPVSARIAVSIEKETALSRNVIGRIPGTGDSRDVIVVGAHMDHLGHGGDGSLEPGSKAIHPGADDNASGTAGVLALARAIKSFPLEHTVLLVTFGGEEMGLLGSSHWVKEPTVSLGRVEAMLNMDMVGRLGQKPLVCGGFGTAKEWPAVVEKAAKEVGLDVATSRDGFGPSDHASFYGKDVPVLFLFTGSHSDYHKPSDTADKIDGPGIERCVRFALAALREIDALPGRPTFEKVGSNPHAGDQVVTGERGPYFGSVPDYGEGDEGEDGVKISGARPGSPADKAGLKAGDRIVEFDGKPIKNLYDYTYAIRGAKVGSPLKVVVVREGKRVTLEATLVAR